jgi:pimeloyl-ACP methyl ester carboxylesterase
MDRSNAASSSSSPLRIIPAGNVVLALAFVVLAIGRADAQPRFEEGHRFDRPSAPAQPEAGFGGRNYVYTSIEHEARGSGDESYWIFHPEGVVDACSRPEAPPVVFLHGWGAMNPMYYGAWVEHLVRRGHVVVYPRYQASLRTPPLAMSGHVVEAVQDAFARLDVDCSWVAIGHSLGGALAANLAVRASATQTGAPILVLAVEPGRALPGMSGPVMALEDLSTLDPATLLVTVVGDDDTVVGDRDARRIFEAATGIPAARKRYVVVHSDRHGVPPLEATHQAPTAPLETLDLLPDEPLGIGNRPRRQRATSRRDGQTVDALDYYAFWKLADGLVALAVDEPREVFSAESVRVLADMGEWSDGREVVKLSFYAELPAAR